MMPHHNDSHRILVRHTVVDAVGKSLYQIASYAFANSFKTPWVRNDLSHSVVNFGKELVVQSQTLLFVISGCLGDVVLRLWNDFEIHLSESRISRIA